MKKLKDIRKKIHPKIEEVERFRKRSARKINQTRSAYIIPIVSFFLFFFLLFTKEPNDWKGLLAIIPMVLGPVTWILIRSRIQEFKKDFKERFKATLLKSFTKEIYPNISLASNAHIPFSSFSHSSLFYEENSLYSGEDLFNGKTENNCNFQFSELETYIVVKNGKNNQRQNIFNGLFFVLDSKMNPVHFPIKIIPQKSKNVILNENVYEDEITLNELFKEANIDYFTTNSKFRKKYKVVTQSIKQAHQFITPALISTLFYLDKDWGTDAYISFIGNKIYIAISSNHNFFDTSVFKSILKNKPLEKIYNEIALCLALIEDFSELTSDLENHQPASLNWKNSAYYHLNDTNNPFLN